MRRRARILVVEDQLDLLHTTSRVLETASYEVFVATAGDVGLQLARKEQPDLILLDVVLSDMDGIEVCRRIKTESKTIFVLLMSDLRTAPDSRARGLEAGADGCIVRPISNRELLAQVEAILRIKQAESQRDGALAALGHTTRLLETILDHTYMLVAYLDPQFNFVRVNRAYAEADDRAVSYFPGKNHFDLYPDAENELIFQRVVETGEPFHVYAKPFEYAEHPERGVSYWDWSLVPTKDTEGDVTGLVLTSANVTDRVQAQEAMRERVKALNCLYGISGLVEKPGISLEEILHGTVDLIPPAWQYPEITAARLALAGQECRTENFSQTAVSSQTADIVVYGQKRGTLEVCYLEGRPERDEGPFLKEERSLLNAIAERLGRVTERMWGVEALQRSEAKYRQLIELAQEGVWAIDADANTTFANPRMAEMLGYTVGEMQGRHLFSFMDERGVEICERNLARRRQGIREQHDFEFLRKDGSRIYTSMETSPITDDNGEYIGALALVADISERRRAEEALSTLLEISRQVALTSELEPLLNLVLDRLKPLVDYSDAAIYQLVDETLVALAHRGALPEEDALQSRFPLERMRFAHPVVFERETVIIPDVQDDASLAQGFRDAAGESSPILYGNVRSWLGTPLIIKDRVIGALTLQHREPDYFTTRQAELALAFANQAAVAIENTRLHGQAQALAALEERQRLARDLHDAVSQTLFSASLAAEVLPRLWERMPDEGRRCLEELRLLTRGALAEMRTLLLELRPTALIEVGLDDLLRQLVEAVAGRARLPVDLAIKGKCSVPPDVHVTLYRITQEALSNVTKHAGATHVSVCLECTPSVLPLGGDAPVSRVALRIEDDGCGFDPRAVPAECLGLCIMRERVQAIGAGLSIESEIGQGTQLIVVWPAPSC